MLAYFIGFVLGGAFIGLGIHAFMAKKAVPFSFWANIPVGNVENIKGYNRAVGKLFIVFGIVFDILCLPLLGGQNSPAIVISIAGIMFESIAAMGIYEIGIMPKYRKK